MLTLSRIMLLILSELFVLYIAVFYIF